jgi:hypothetical protein
MAKSPLLDLSTLIERPVIRVDGANYQLKSPEELTLLESQQFTTWGAEIEKLAKDGTAVEELDMLVSVVARATLTDMPGDVFGRLSPSQRMAIVEVFTALLLSRRLRLAGAIATAARRTGVNSSPGSSSPSAAIPDGGSPAPQLPS